MKNRERGRKGDLQLMGAGAVEAVGVQGVRPNWIERMELSKRQTESTTNTEKMEAMHSTV